MTIDLKNEMFCPNCGNRDPAKFEQEEMLLMPPDGPPRSEPIGYTCSVCDEMIFLDN